MGMNLGSKEDEVIMEMNTTPLIDVMLVLLVMLIITIPPQLNSIGMNMPVDNPNVPKRDPTIIRINLDEVGNLYWNNEKIDSQTVLDENFKTIQAMQDQPEVHIKPNPKTPYKVLAKVMSTAQKNKVTKIGIVGNERFIEEK